MTETDEQPDLHTAWQRMHAERQAEREPEAAAALAVAKVDEALVALERAVTNLRSALQQ